MSNICRKLPTRILEEKHLQTYAVISLIIFLEKHARRKWETEKGGSLWVWFSSTPPKL